MTMESAINLFHYSYILYQSRYLGNKPDTSAPCVNENIVLFSEIIPVGWDTLATSMNPYSAPLVQLPVIVSTFSTSLLPSKSDASKENRFNVCDVVSVKMTE